MKITTKEFVRRAKLDAEIAALAYSVWCEQTHPVSDHVMKQITMQHLLDKIQHLNFSDMERLSQGDRSK